MLSNQLLFFAFGVMCGVSLGALACLLWAPNQRGGAAVDRQLSAAVAGAVSQLDAAAESTAARLATAAAGQAAREIDVGRRDLEHAGVAIGRHLDGMEGELRRVGELVSGLRQERAVHHSELVSQFDAAARTGAQLARTTQQLRDALANPRARGQWGERLAEDVLRAAGFVEGVSYLRQQRTSAGTVPDFTFPLPDGLVVHMDVKFPIDNYLRYQEADDADRARCADAFCRDVRARITELDDRSYVEPGVTLDFVIVFIPNEAVYAFAHEHAPNLVDLALAHQVVLCSPSTLFAVLGVIRRAVDNFVLARTSQEILDTLVGVSAEWDRFGEAVDGLGKRLGGVQTSYDALAGPRRRQLQRRLDAVAELRERGC